MRSVTETVLLLCLAIPGTTLAQDPAATENLESLQPMDRIGVLVDGFRPAVIPLDVDASPDGVVASKTIGIERNVRFLQAKLLLIAPEPVQGLTVQVLDGDGDIITELPFEGLTGVKEFWTGLVPGKELRLEVRGARQAASTQLIVSEVYRESLSAGPLSDVGTNDRVLIGSVTDGPLKNLARSTARLTFARDNKLYNCTSFLFGPAAAPRMMTNQHCINDVASCASAVVLFDYDRLSPIPSSNQRRCRRIVATDYTLDYTVFELDALPAQGIAPLPLQPRRLAANEPTVIVQHPGGQPKQVSVKDCGVVNPVVNGRGPRTDFTHGCDTLGGSSGSAIVTPDGQVIGLHHLGTGGAFPSHNRGVRLELIAQDLQRKEAAR
jgi:hypothetical protein